MKKAPSAAGKTTGLVLVLAALFLAGAAAAQPCGPCSGPYPWPSCCFRTPAPATRTPIVVVPSPTSVPVTPVPIGPTATPGAPGATPTASYTGAGVRSETWTVGKVRVGQLRVDERGRVVTATGGDLTFRLDIEDGTLVPGGPCPEQRHGLTCFVLVRRGP